MFDIAIIGGGRIGRKRAAALRKHGNCRLVVTADADRNAAELLAKEFGGETESDWHQVVSRSDIDVIIVATYNKFLAPISVAGLENGKHVLCEKPLGRSSKESEAIIGARKKSGTILKTGFNHRHHPGISKAKELVEKKEIGDLYLMRCRYGHGGRPGYEKEWRADKDLCGGGELLDQGVHVVDLFRWFAGDFDEAFGYIGTYFWDMKVEDNAFALFRRNGGAIASMHTSWTQWKNLFSFEVFGSKGYIIVEGLGGNYGIETLKIGRRKKRSGDSDSRKMEYPGGPPDEEIIEFPGPDISWEEEWKEFISAIGGNREPIGNGQDGMQANRMIEAIYQSNHERRPIEIVKMG